MIILVCGLPKSASTYAAEMACMLAETAGHQQLRLRSRVAEAGGSDKRFVATLDRSTMDRILGVIRREDLLVLKTHAPYTAFLAPYLEEGAIVPVVTFRDSWDAALSVYEAGVRARERGDFSQNFHRFDTIPAAIDATARNWEWTQTWLDCGHGIDLEFESLVRRPRAAAVRIASAMGLPEDSASALDFMASTRKPYNYNVGVAGRAADVFSDEERAYARKHLQRAVSWMETWKAANAPECVTHEGLRADG